MRPLRIRLTTLLGVVAILTINDFPLIQNPQSKITYSQALAQTPAEWKAQADQLLRQGNEQSQTSQFEVAKQAWQQVLTLYPEIGDRVGEEQTLNNLGGALLQSGNFPAAEKTLLAGLQIWESLRAGLGSNDANKVSIFETQASSYVLLLKTFAAQKKTDAALEIAERSRSKAFVELLASRLISNRDERSPIASPTIERIKQTAKAHQATLVAYSIIYDDSPIPGKQQTQASDLFIWVVQPTGEVGFRRVDLKPLSQQQNTSLTNLVLSTREAIGLTSGGTSVIPNVEKRQTKTPQILALPKGHLEVIPRQERQTQPQTKGLQQLYQLLIQPIADLLPKDPNAHVIFIPQGELFLVPFPALQDTSGQYLIEQHTILTAPSIQVLDFTRQQRQRIGSRECGLGAVPPCPPQSGEFLVVGNPTMPSVLPRAGEPPQQLLSLPGAEQEAKAIAPLLNTQAITGNQATKTAILQRMPRARIIHLATTAIADNERGIGSAIALAPDPPASGTPPYQGGDRGGDGWLTAEEILNLKLNAELVVLSGCDTGLGKITGDGVIGLSRSFIAAGVPSAIVSLGYIPDDATAFLMTEFYRNLSSTPDKAKALRQAMLTTMKKYPNPLSWGAFTLIGEAE